MINPGVLCTDCKEKLVRQIDSRMPKMFVGLGVVTLVGIAMAGSLWPLAIAVFCGIIWLIIWPIMRNMYN